MSADLAAVQVIGLLLAGAAAGAVGAAVLSVLLFVLLGRQARRGGTDAAVASEPAEPVQMVRPGVARVVREPGRHRRPEPAQAGRGGDAP